MHVIMQTSYKFCKSCGFESERYADGRCKKCVRARNAAWAAKNKEKRYLSSRRWAINNKSKIKEISATYRKNNQAAINERRRQVRKYDPSSERIKAAKRRAQKRAISGVISKNIVQLLLEKQRGLCACCQQPLNETYHLDHKIPLSRGGTHTDDNLQLLLPRCNLMKYTLTHDEFMLQKSVAV